MANVKAVVTGVDTYRWVDADGTVCQAEKGDTIEISSDEFDRGVDLEALSKASTREAKDAAGDQKDNTTPASEKPVEEPVEWPKTHKELDSLAEEFGVVFDKADKTVEAKQIALADAGHLPPPPAE